MLFYLLRVSLSPLAGQCHLLTDSASMPSHEAARPRLTHQYPGAHVADALLLQSLLIAARAVHGIWQCPHSCTRGSVMTPVMQ